VALWRRGCSPGPTRMYSGPPGGVRHEKVHTHNTKQKLGAVGAACDTHYPAGSAGLMHWQFIGSCARRSPLVLSGSTRRQVQAYPRLKLQTSM